VRTDPDGKGLLAVRALWEAVGCRVRELSPEDHDRLIALSSHLPHVVAACLVNAVCDRALDLTSRGFLDTTRVASGDPMLWVDICAANRKEILAALDALTVEIRDFAKALGAGNTDALRALLEQAKQRRDGRLTTDDQRPTNDR
jgi:prephenate dehydrogenase